MTKDEALKLALEALESCTPADTSTGHVVWPSYDEQAVKQAITAIKQVLAALVKDNSNYRLDPPGLDPAGGIQVSKVWLDDDKLIAKPIPFVEFYKAAPAQPNIKSYLEKDNSQFKFSDYESNGMRHNKPSAAPVQEPVVFYRCNGCGHAYEQVHPTSCDCMEAGGFDRVEYYTTPPAAQSAAPVQEQIERAKQIWREDQQRIAELSAEIDRLTAAQPASVQEPVAWPDGLIDRIKAAEQRIQDGHAPRRIPADPTDVDLVLAEVRYALEGKQPPFWIKTTPLAAKQPWVGLTEQERNAIEDYCEMIVGKPVFEAIEAKLKEKNT
jgi:hypothetical protein